MLKPAVLVKLESEVLVVVFQRTRTNRGRHGIHPDTIWTGGGGHREEEESLRERKSIICCHNSCSHGEIILSKLDLYYKEETILSSAQNPTWVSGYSE